MKRIKKLLPDKYYLDKNFFTLKGKIFEEFEKDQKEWGNDVYNWFGNYDPKFIVKEIIEIVLMSIKPKYSIKNKKFY